MVPLHRYSVVPHIMYSANAKVVNIKHNKNRNDMGIQSINTRVTVPYGEQICFKLSAEPVFGVNGPNT